ncbi:MAG: response regulator [Ferruginibacter sp.]
MKILIIGDQPIMLKTMELKLKRDGHLVLTASNEQDANRLITDTIIDLVITDNMMTETAGPEVRGYVRNHSGKKIPVIVLSAMGQENMVAEALSSSLF